MARHAGPARLHGVGDFRNGPQVQLLDLASQVGLAQGEALADESAFLLLVGVDADPEAAGAARPSISPYQFAKGVEKALDEYVRPMLAKDGGDVELIDIKDHIVYCRLAGSCAGCASADQTLKMMIEKNLKDMVDERIRVIAV
jgi:Fe-S cluster biogenesis protein NfuA